MILLTFAAIISVAVFIASETNQEGAEKLLKLRQMVTETPLLPGLEKSHVSESYKHRSAMITVNYDSTTNFGEVKDFYSRVLVGKGWGKPVMDSPIPVIGDTEKKWLTFRRGEFLIAIAEQEPSRINVVYRWERN